MVPGIDLLGKHPISVLHELSQRKKIPVFRETYYSSPLGFVLKIFYTYEEVEYTTDGRAFTLKEARTLAAIAMIEALPVTAEDIFQGRAQPVDIPEPAISPDFPVHSEYERSILRDIYATANLNQFCIRHSFSLPTYNELEMQGPSHFPRFKIELTMEEMALRIEVLGPSKKRIRLELARRAIISILRRFQAESWDAIDAAIANRPAVPVQDPPNLGDQPASGQQVSEEPASDQAVIDQPTSDEPSSDEPPAIMYT